MNLARNSLVRNWRSLYGKWGRKIATFFDQYGTDLEAMYALVDLGNQRPDGYVVGVRRDSDDADASFTAAEVADGTLAAWVGVGNGYAHTLYDQSGNGKDAVQTTPENQPLIVDSGALVVDANGNVIFKTDGSNDLLTYDGSVIVGTDYTAIAIAQRYSTAESFVLGGSAATGNANMHLGWRNGGSQLRFAQFANDLDMADVFTVPETSVLTGINTSTGKEIYLDGGLGNSDSTATNLSAYAGASIGSFVAGRYAVGVAAVLLYSADKSADRAAIEAALSTQITTALS